MKNAFLIISVALTLAAVLPYIRDILRGTTKPNIVSWMTWTLLTGIATIAEISAHDYKTAIFTFSATLETLSIVLLGLRYGYAKYSKFDAICQIASLSGFLFWWLFSSPAAAVIAVVIIDFIGALPTVRHSYLAPAEETWSAFALACAGGIFVILALNSFNWASLTYPIYVVIINAAIVGTILKMRRTLLPKPKLQRARP